VASVNAPDTQRLPPFTRVLDQHGPALLRFCASQSGTGAADDVFQETMIAALRAYDTVRDPAAVKAWLFSIAARKAIDDHRVTARSAIPIADPEPVGTVAPPPDSDVWDDVKRLPEKQRQAVGLRFLGDLSHHEIGEAMQTSEAAARRNVFEGLKRLRTDLAPDPPTTPPAKEPR
jgi:RNA polymerase sigma factor (sigma-70 family)